MKSCLESMQAFERFPTYKSILILSLKVEKMVSREERCSNQTKLLLCWLPCYNIMASKQPLSNILVFFPFHKPRLDLSKLIQTHSQTVFSKGSQEKQSHIIVRVLISGSLPFRLYLELRRVFDFSLKSNRRALVHYPQPECNCVWIYTRVKHIAHSNTI